MNCKGFCAFIRIKNKNHVVPKIDTSQKKIGKVKL